MPGTGFAEVSAGARGLGGSVVGYVRGEFGARLTPSASLFGFGEATLNTQLQPAWLAGIGARVTW